jgi:hypothetical protein
MAGVVQAERDQPLHAKLAHVAECHRRADGLLGSGGHCGTLLEYPLTVLRTNNMRLKNPNRRPFADAWLTNHTYKSPTLGDGGRREPSCFNFHSDHGCWVCS